MYLLAFDFTDLVILGCHISEGSIDITKEVFLSLSSSLHIESHISKNCSPVEAEVFLKKNVARFCVLLMDAETVFFAYTTLAERKREYEDLLKTAGNRVGKMVSVCYYYYYYYFDDNFEDDYDNNINNNNSSNGDDIINNNSSNNNGKWTVFINGGQ